MSKEPKPEQVELVAKKIADEALKIMKRKFIRIDCKPCSGCRGKRSIRVNLPTFYMLLYLEAFYEAIFSEEIPLCKLINDSRINMLLRCIEIARF